MTSNITSRIGTALNRVTTATSVASTILQPSSILLTGVTNTPSTAAINAAKQNAPDSIVHVNSTMNNIQITISNLEGETISRSSGGVLGYKHRQRASPQAAKEMAEQAAAKAVTAGYKVAHVEVKGPSRGRGVLIRGLQTAGLKITDIRDVTPIPTNGCRPPAARRL